jgi:hypothetical protein
VSLLDQITLDLICPLLVEEIELFINTHPNIKGNEEAFVYALGQVAQMKIDKMKMEDGDKGLVVATLIRGLVAANKIPLAIHNERVRAIQDRNDGTVH